VLAAAPPLPGLNPRPIAKVAAFITLNLAFDRVGVILSAGTFGRTNSIYNRTIVICENAFAVGRFVSVS
jgi:hypothetical protein